MMETTNNVLKATVTNLPDTQLIKVLDKGYVRLVDHMGTDLSVVNAARASFAKESTLMSQGDARLINFLIRENHTSPFRHATVSYEFKAPLMVARQHWKYIVGSDHTMDGWNESSRRYITSNEEFYVIDADQWRSAPEDKKQGSGDPVDPFTGSFYTEAFMKWCDEGMSLYNTAVMAGICTEQARVFLPAYALYVNYRWTASLQSVLHFLAQRLEHDAQKEIQDYAKAVYRLTQPIFPITFEAFGLQ